jgi:hypothetical protein
MPWPWPSNDEQNLTPLEHNKFVGLSHVGYAALHLVSLVVSMAFMGFMFSNIFAKAATMGGEPPFPPAFFTAVLVFVGLINVALTIPSVVAAYALLKRRPWAKIAGIVGAVTAALSFPFGTLVAVYTFWFLFSDPGKAIYGDPRPLPPNPPAQWAGGER